MKTLIVSFSIFMTVLVCLSLSMVPWSQAEIGPYQQLGPVEKNRKAASGFFIGLSQIYLSFNLLEHGNISGANVQLQKAQEVYFAESLNIYTEISNSASTRPIILNNIPLEQFGRIAADLRDSKGQFPNTLKEVTNIVVKEFADFLEFIKATKFGSNPNVNRQRVRKLYEKIFRLTTLGLSTSDLISIVPRKQW